MKAHMLRQEEHELSYAAQITVSFRPIQGTEKYLSPEKKEKNEKKVSKLSIYCLHK